MPYVRRSPTGEILAISVDAQDGYIEEDPNADDIAEFTHKISQSLRHLHASDRNLARVTEDLIHLLVAKQVILFTELPTAVQEKLSEREKLREGLAEGKLDILGNQETI